VQVFDAAITQSTRKRFHGVFEANATESSEQNPGMTPEIARPPGKNCEKYRPPAHCGKTWAEPPFGAAWPAWWVRAAHRATRPLLQFPTRHVEFCLAKGGPTDH